MGKLEKEIKVLDIKIDETREKLLKMGALFKGEKNQKIYVYDLPTLYYRFLEIKFLMDSNSQVIILTNLKKLKTLMLEYTALIPFDELESITKELNIKDLNRIDQLPIEQVKAILSNLNLEKSFSKYSINPNKWIRLRESNGKTELTTKHILEKKKSNFQNVIENEIEVSSLEETNLLLESIGISRKSYQEKIRFSYEYMDAEIEIDIWPLLKPYIEIECDDENTIDYILKELNLMNHEIVSLNTEQLYKRINIDIHSLVELKF